MARPAASMLVGIRSIDTLDLDDIVREVRRERKWSAATAEKAELWYRRFLAMSHKQNGRPVFGICKLSDYVWHAHITSTARYRKDCQRIFGRYLDHTPGKPAGWQRRLAASSGAYQKTFHLKVPYFVICCY
jgi:hypothetical protein